VTRAMDRQRAFTLIELVTTLAIAAIAMAAVVPSAATFVREHRVAATTERLASALTMARTTAIARRTYVSVAPLGTGWQEGWRVFVEHDPPRGQFNGRDAVLLLEDRVSSDLAALTPGANAVTFSPVGRVVAAGPPGGRQHIGFRMESAGRLGEIGAMGQVRVCIPASQPTACK